MDKVVVMLQGCERRTGFVKWFGGYNKKTQKENNFGFLLDTLGHDVFLSKKDWDCSPLPSEGDIVTYILQASDGKYSAREACRLSVLDTYMSICVMPGIVQSIHQSEMQKKFCEYLCKIITSATKDEINTVIGGDNPSVFSIVRQHAGFEDNFAFLIKTSEVKITEKSAWVNMPPSFISRFEQLIATQISGLEISVARERCNLYLGLFSSPLIIFLLVNKIYTTTEQLGNNTGRIYDYIKSVVIDGDKVFPDYLQVSYNADLNLNHGRSSSSLLQNILDFLYFKKSLFEKTTDYISIYALSTRLGRNIETFVLYNFFSLIGSCNSRDEVYKVLLHRLWEGITSRAINPEQQTSKILKLFPACLTLRYKLSCEAVYWAKRDIFLCRGRQCLDPKVLPSAKKDYFEFNIYDWFGHYGINYFSEKKIQSKDFPIKLAGYFNRIREIYKIIHCQACGELMLPNMKYARTEYKAIENGVLTVKSMAATYRLTVFHCNNHTCDEFERGHYINHCIGRRCYSIVDSRKLKTKCSAGLYICSDCGSCCAEHARTDPDGFCPDCGNLLEVTSRAVKGHKYYYDVAIRQCRAAGCKFVASE